MVKDNDVNTGLVYTQRIHDIIAIPKFYNRYDFRNVQSMVGTYADLNDGIDYTANDCIGSLWTIQERFRKYEYRKFGDITFRYNSKSNNANREFFKIKADYFLYGIVNKDETDFEWSTIVVVPDLITAIVAGKIPYIIKDNKAKNDSRFLAVNINDIEHFNPELVWRL